MNISRFELSLDFSEETRLHTLPYLVSEALGEQELEEDYTSTVFRNEKDKFAVRWNCEICGIIREDVNSGQECIKEFVSTLETINNVAPIGRISGRALRINWIFPSKEKQFNALEMKYRQLFIKENELFSLGYDSSVICDMKYDESILHHQSGAMGLAQLQEGFKTFTIKEGHPSLFLFLTTEVEDSRLVTYTKDDMGRFMHYSFQLCNSHAENFGKIVGRIL